MNVAAWESLHKATLELAKSSGLKQRLTDAWSRYLEDLAVSEMPTELRPDFEALRLAMTRVRPFQGETAVAATVRKMSMGEADDCAQRIVALLDALHRTVTAVQPKNGQGHARGAPGVESPTVRIPTLISVNRA
ncbi:MAG TPA: hypothetical protein VH856_08105 [Steroidobacteraceae bacterium]